MQRIGSSTASPGGGEADGVRQYLNAFVRGCGLGPPRELPEQGGWDEGVACPLQQVRNRFFYGVADPNGKLDNTDTLFRFLVSADGHYQALESSLSSETYVLAVAMMPGGDHRSDLGNDRLDEGALFKGRGFVQLTGHDNHREIGEQIGVDLVNDPDQANDSAVAAAVLAQFLKNKEAAIRTALRADALAHARKLVNGGHHGLHEFEAAFAAGRRHLGIAIPPKARPSIALGKAGQ